MTPAPPRHDGVRGTGVRDTAGWRPSVTLDVWQLPPRDAARAMLASATWTRRSAGESTGRVSYARLLGTGDTRFTVASARWTRWAAVTVWTPEAVTAGGTTLDPAWARHAAAHFHADLAPLTARGRWSGRTPFAAPGRAVAVGWSGEILSLTRARLRPRRALTFWRAVPPVAHSLADVAGLQAAMGVGEAPVAFQGTLSLWSDPAAVAAYAWRDPEHRDVVDRTPREQWYAEELFARFAVLDRTSSLAAWGRALPSTPRRRRPDPTGRAA